MNWFDELSFESSQLWVRKKNIHIKLNSNIELNLLFLNLPDSPRYNVKKIKQNNIIKEILYDSNLNYGLRAVPILFFTSFTFFILDHCFIWQLLNRLLEIKCQHAAMLVQTDSSVLTFGGFCNKQITKTVLHVQAQAPVARPIWSDIYIYIYYHTVIIN